MTSTIQMSDELLRQYVDGIFSRYDIDHSNTLTLDELHVFFNDLLASRGATRKMSIEEVQQSLKAMDSNNDGQITKMELFNSLKKMNKQSNVLGVVGEGMIGGKEIRKEEGGLYPGFSTYAPIQAQIEQNQNYYNHPQTYNSNQLQNLIPAKEHYQPQQQPITVAPQSYQAIPYGNQKNHGKPAKKQKAKLVATHGQGQGYLPMAGTSMGMYGGGNPWAGGFGMGGPMMGMGPMSMGRMGMGMGHGPYGMMGGMGGYGMNPFTDLLGGLFGLGRFY